MVPTKSFPIWKSSSHFSKELPHTDFGISDALGHKGSGWVQCFPPWMIWKLGCGVCFGDQGYPDPCPPHPQGRSHPVTSSLTADPKENLERATISTIKMLQLLFADRI